MTRLEAIRAAIAKRSPVLLDPGNQGLLNCLADGIEAGLDWEKPVLTEDQVIASSPKTPRERELEGQLDKVLRWVELREGWISAGDTDRRIEFRELSLEVKTIAADRKRTRETR